MSTLIRDHLPAICLEEGRDILRNSPNHVMPGLVERVADSDKLIGASAP
jgi:hypothetical protein